MFHNTRILAAAAAALIGVTGLAQASVTETGSERFVRTDAEGGGSNDGVYTTFGPSIYGVFNDSNASSIGNSSDGGDALATQISDISPFTYSGSLYAEAHARNSGFDITNGYGESSFWVEFTVSSSVDYHIVGDVLASMTEPGETAEAYVELTNVGVGGSPDLTLASESPNGSDSFDVTGTLLPGDYRLTAYARTFLTYALPFSTESGSGEVSANFDMTFTKVPAPGAMALLAMGGLIGARRRRA